MVDAKRSVQSVLHCLYTNRYWGQLRNVETSKYFTVTLKYIHKVPFILILSICSPNFFIFLFGTSFSKHKSHTDLLSDIVHLEFLLLFYITVSSEFYVKQPTHFPYWTFTDTLQVNRPKAGAPILSHIHTHTSQITHKQFFSPTIFAVKVDLHFPLLRPKQGLRHLSDCQSLGVRSIHEVTCARLLHDLSAWVTTHVAEAIVAEDDGAVLHSCIGYDKLTTCGWNETSLLYFPQRQHEHLISGTNKQMEACKRIKRLIKYRSLRTDFSLYIKTVCNVKLSHCKSLLLTARNCRYIDNITDTVGIKENITSCMCWEEKQTICSSAGKLLYSFLYLK